MAVTPQETLRTKLDLEIARLQSDEGNSFSRYSLTYLHPNFTVRQNRFGVWNKPRISLLNPFYKVVAQEDLGRLDNIASDYYNDPRMWWAIAQVNLIRNLFTDMEVGMTLVIPRKEAVIESITNGNRALFEE